MLILLYSILFFILIIFLLFISNFYKTIILRQAPFISTKKIIIKEIVNSLNFNNKKVIYELGSGLCLLLRELEKKKEKNEFIAVEYSTTPFLLSKFLLFVSKSKIKIIKKNLFKVDLKKADIIYFYLMPSMMSRLTKKLKKECKPDTLIISNSFKLDKLNLINKTQIKNTTIYYYKI